MTHDQRGRWSPLRSASYMSVPIPLTGVKTRPLQCEYRWIPIFSPHTFPCFLLFTLLHSYVLIHFSIPLIILMPNVPSALPSSPVKFPSVIAHPMVLSCKPSLWASSKSGTPVFLPPWAHASPRLPLPPLFLIPSLSLLPILPLLFSINHSAKLLQMTELHHTRIFANYLVNFFEFWISMAHDLCNRILDKLMKYSIFWYILKNSSHTLSSIFHIDHILFSFQEIGQEVPETPL